MVLAIRALRVKDRRAAEQEITNLSAMLTQEREQRVQAELVGYRARLVLAENGIDLPPENP